MRKAKSRLAALFLCAFVLVGGAAEVWGQGYRVKVYNPQVYSRTRQTMSNRAAARAALKKKQRQRRAARARNALH
ncbi:MAG TPA: hypothetical protein VGX48_11055 [Pyrinomonadaceae bacterium]|jgi:hypothetical protein|nr:hypothetical protein [Pyrinomonadaceae bacterium]